MLFQDEEEMSLHDLMDEINSKIAAKENLIGVLVGSGSAVEIEVYRGAVRLHQQD